MSTEAERRRICVKRLVYLNEPEGGERAEPDIHCWATYDAGCAVKNQIGTKGLRIAAE